MRCAEVELHQARRHYVVDCREAFTVEDGRTEGLLHCLVCRHLTSMGSHEVEPVGTITEPYRRDARNGLKPHTSGSVTPHLEVEMIAVAVHRVAQISGACILYGRTGRHHKCQFRMRLHGIPDCPANAVVHHLLTIAIVGKAAMGAFARIGPRLVETIRGIGIGLQALSILYKMGKVRLESAGQTRLLTHLLEGDILPGLVLYDVGKSRPRLVGATTALHLAILEGVVDLRHVHPMRMKALSATIGVADNHLYACLAT